MFSLCAALCLQAGCNKENDKKEPFTLASNVVYGSAINFQGATQQLEMDVYMPLQTEARNPLLVVLHGGGFYSGGREELKEFCQYFAARNFTAVTISYRLGWNVGSSTNFCGGDANSVIKAGYRATQDLHAALRFLVTNASQYKIDTSRIFVGGSSAGAITALSAAFVSQSEFNEFYPQVQTQLGGLHSSGNSLSQNYRIKGVLNMWGGIMNPAVIGEADQIPVIGFHASGDPVVPYAQGNFAGCNTYPEFFGSKSVYDALRSRGYAAVLHTHNSVNHGAYKLEYLAQNSYCFLKKVINGEKPTGSFSNNLSTCP